MTAAQGGRMLALIAIVGLALNMRAVLSTVSPIAAAINEDIPLTTGSLALLGALPPIIFAAVGLLVPALASWLGGTRLALVALAAIALGNIGRGVAGDLSVLIGSSALALGGIGVANVLLPSLVKRYFPGRIVPVTAAAMAAMAIGTGVPAVVVNPLSETWGWNVALGVWGPFAIVAAVPWLLLLLRGRDSRDSLGGAAPTAPTGMRRVARSPLAWALLAAFTVAQWNIYAMFAWLPVVLVDIAAVTPQTAGIMLGIYAFMGLIVSLSLGAISRRMSDPTPFIHVAVAAFLVGYGGLILVPTGAPWAWVVLAGIGPTIMHVCLMLVGLRSRTPEGAVALSSFMQSFGYALGAAGPIAFGALHDASGRWDVPLAIMLLLALIGSVSAVALRRRRYVEDEWG
ncbi:MFS transporter [Salinibacterium sp. SYSU T00001]|uniref:MFS transporter n=1 Tax=Homoserinimonas sedimenticola TaxID=2986805 RepID=UPI002235FF10|nr:MFS transporter [Salinibacterium sedimenticola]MCW4385475.1 MFS transporter [Salinibacterium sedimenticola]